ncbi:hypothetical protein HY490_05950 [Candidatus Woesearchaeota archaeon]|nr:hypothetical protein [Candidatus Woesearchaeota archaeon]
MDVPSGRHGRGMRQAMRLINVYADEHGNNDGQADNQELIEAQNLLREELALFQDSDTDGTVSVEEDATYHRTYASRSGYHVLHRFLNFPE